VHLQDIEGRMIQAIKARKEAKGKKKKETIKS